MSTLRLSTAGESHGLAEVCILEGIPAGLTVTPADIDVDLARRQQGYGRGGRMAIEADHCRFLAGVRLGRTLGAPICIIVENKDHDNWVAVMSAERPAGEPAGMSGRVTIPRPGHADLAGLAKYGYEDIRDVLERASARETVGRVAGGAVCKRLLSEMGVKVRGRVVSIGTARTDAVADLTHPNDIDWAAVDASPVGCDDPIAAAAMCEQIDRAREAGESLGGVFEIWCWGLCPGLGGYGCPQDRLDGRLLGALGSIPAIKGVEIGEGFANAGRIGSLVHDAITVREDDRGAWITRETNHAAGIEGGMTNGMPVVIHAAMKPIPTLTAPLQSVDVSTLRPIAAHVERSDVAAVPAARVVGEAMAAVTLAEAYLCKFGGDSLEQLRASVLAYEGALEDRRLWRRS
ncbi:MAG: chorismate synthase [bacterium]